MTRSTTLKKPTFRTRRWITSTGEAVGSLGLDGTTVRGAGPASSTPAEVGVVRPPTGRKYQ